MKLRLKMSVFACIIWAALLTSTSARLAVMSVDLGGEFMKIAIVKPGVPMEIVLNKESNRKTATLVAFRDGERHFGNQAENTALKFPAKGYRYLNMILGRPYDDPQIATFRQKFPYYNLLKDEERGTVLFKVDDETSYSPEELLAMILEKAREYAQDFAEQDIKDIVITVPAFYNQAERRAVMAAANMVGFNVLQLMSDNAAVALNYGVFRRKNFNTTMQYYMFYDMGSTSTTATIVGYNVVKTKEGTRMESNPQLTIKGVGFDRSLGGLEFTLRLRAHLAKMFNDQKKTPQKVEENYRAMAKLLKESERVKKVLSANVEHQAQVEGLLDEKDFRGTVTRAELEEMTKDLFARVTKPIEDALKVSEITLPEISEVILMGGATRMPKVQDLLVKHLGRSDLGKSINTDEAAAMGAVYQAAYLGKGFKVKKFGVREGNIYPINVEFEKQKSEGDDPEEKARTIKRTLFGRMNPFPQKKVMTFNKHTKDFGFNTIYSGLDFLPEDQKKSFGSGLISKYNLEGVETALTKNKDQAESKGIKAHFRMDESGLLTLDKVESVFEKNSSADDEAEKSTWSKLGSAIGGLFGGSKQEEDNKVEDSNENDEDRTAKQNTSDNSSPPQDEKAEGEGNTEKKEKEEEQENESSPQGDKPKEDPPEKKADEGETEEQKEDEAPKESEKEEEGKKEESDDKPEEEQKQEKKDEEKETTEKSEESKEKEETESKSDKEEDKDQKKDGTKDKEEEKKEKVPKTVLIKEDIASKEEVMDVVGISADRFKESKKRLSDLSAADKEKVELEKAKNELESFIFDKQDKLDQGPHQQCTTEEEREKLQSELAQASDWLYEQPDDAKKTVFTDKLKSLKALTKDLDKRVFELGERPKALEALRSALNQTSVFLATVKNMTDLEDPIFTQVELDTMEKLINETLVWRDEGVATQEKLAAHEMPSLLVEDIAQKISALDREMRYLINKAKNFRPKPKPKADTNKTEADNTTKTADSEKEDSPKTGEPEDQPGEGTESRQEPVEPQEPESTEERTSSGKRRPKSCLFFPRPPPHPPKKRKEKFKKIN